MVEILVWYDGGCPLCRREIDFMRRLDTARAITFLNVASDAVGHDDVACPLDRAQLLARFHASEDGRLLSGAAAFAAMWRAIPRLRPLGVAARHPVALAMLERLYRVFLRLRPWLQAAARRLEASRTVA